VRTAFLLVVMTVGTPLGARAAGTDALELEALYEDGALSEENLEALREWAEAVETPGGPVGRVRLSTALAAADALVPPMLLQAHVEGPVGLRGGAVATLTRRFLGAVHADARGRALVARAPEVSLHVPKFYVQWTGEQASVLVGTYRLGFGQRLTLDTTGWPSPQGFMGDEGFLVPGTPERRCMRAGGAKACAEEAGRVTPDFGWTEGFRGVVGTVHGQVEGVTLSLTGFGSYQTRDVLASELLGLEACRRPPCKAPEVLLEEAGRQGARLVSRRLPDVFHELAGGGHVRVGRSSREQVGLTAWGAWPLGGVEGMALGFQPQARYPEQGGFGAVGVDGAWGAGLVDLFFEVARSFDEASGQGGGWGALQRTVLGNRRQELELSLRWYGRDFANPYGRALSAPDEFEGLRARNEAGVRLRAMHRDETWRLRGQVEAWTASPESGEEEPVHGVASLRVDWLGLPELRPSVGVEHRDGGYRLLGLVRFAPAEALVLTAQYRHAWLLQEREPGSFQEEGHAVLQATVQPLPVLRVQGRVSWEEELRAVGDVTWNVMEGLSTRARYELVVDARAPESPRSPVEPPQHLFRLELEGNWR
jgi:hypothetical protein